MASTLVSPKTRATRYRPLLPAMLDNQAAAQHRQQLRQDGREDYRADDGELYQHHQIGEQNHDHRKLAETFVTLAMTLAMARVNHRRRGA